MANGDFLRDISEGIFGRLGEVRKEQEAKDEAQKRGSIAVLSEAFKSAEPGGQQEILRLMGDVIGVKGKLKGFWNAFSGMPDRSVEDQLGTTMREFSSRLMEPGAAKAARGKAVTDLALGALDTGVTTSPKTLSQAAGLEGKIIFRDPREEKIREIKARGEVAEQVAAERAQLHAHYQGIQREDTQRHQEEMKKLTESLKAGRPLETEAGQLAFLNKRPGGKPTLEDYEQAAATLQVRGQLNEEAMRALWYYRMAATEEKETAKTAGGIKPGEAVRIEAARRKEINAIQKQHQGALGKYTEAKEKEDSIVTQMNAIASQYLGSKFNAEKGVFEGGDVGGANVLSKNLLSEYRKAKADRKAAEKEAQGAYNISGRKIYAPYVKRGATHLDPLEIVETPTPPTRGDVNSVRTGVKPAPAMGRFDKIMRGVNPAAFKDGQIIDMRDGTKWKVTGKGKDHIRLSPVLQQ